MSQQVILENDPILKAVIQKLTEKNYLETKYPLLNRGEIIGCTEHNINLQWVHENYNKIGIDAKELQRYLQEWSEDEKAEYITGETIHVNGGLYMQ